MAHRVAPEAEADLDAIWYYVATESSSAAIADRLIDSLTSRFLLLATHSYLGRTCEHDLGINVRSFPVGEFLILYIIEDADVLILRVIHGHRDIAVTFGS